MTAEIGSVSIMWTEIPEAIAYDLNEWYDREHVRNRVDVPGYIWGKRYKAVHGGPSYMAVYAAEALRTHVVETVLPALVAHHGVVAAHLWERNAETTAMASRSFPGENLPRSMMVPDWLLAYEGTSLEDVLAAKNGLLKERDLRSHGGESDLLFAAMQLTFRYEHKG